MQVEIKDKGFYAIPYCDRYNITYPNTNLDITLDTKYYRCIYGDGVMNYGVNKDSKITSDKNISIEFILRGTSIDMLDYLDIPNGNYQVNYDSFTNLTTFTITNLKDKPIYCKQSFNYMIFIKNQYDVCDLIIIPYYKFDIGNSQKTITIKPISYNNDIIIVGDKENLIFNIEIRSNNISKYEYLSSIVNGRTNLGFKVVTDDAINISSYSYIEFNNNITSPLRVRCKYSQVATPLLKPTGRNGYRYFNSFNNYDDTLDIYDGSYESIVNDVLVYQNNPDSPTTRYRLGLSMSYRSYVNDYLNMEDIVLYTKTNYNFIYRNKFNPISQSLLEETVHTFNAINITLYNNSSENHRVDKTNYLEELVTLNGVFRDEVSIINPVFRIETDIIPTCNYCYINIFNRYYYVDNIVMVRNNLWELYCSCDTLMSFKVHIYELKGYIGRHETKYNPYIIDEKLPSMVEPLLTYDHTPLYPVYTTERNIILQTITNGGSKIADTTAQSNPYGVGNMLYALDANAMVNFASQLMQPDIKNSITNFFNSPAEAVVGAVYYPFPIWYMFRLNEFKTTDTNKIRVGNFDISLTNGNEAKLLGNNYYSEFTLTFGDSEIQGIYNNFLDYSPYTKTNIFVPFYGFVDVDINLILGKKLDITYKIDLGSGYATFTINVIKDNLKTIIYSGDCIVGVPVSLSSSNSLDIIRNNVQTVVNTVGDIVSIASGNTSFKTGSKLFDKRTKEYKVAKAQNSIDVLDKSINLATDTTCELINNNVTHYKKGRIGQGFNKFFTYRTSDWQPDISPLLDYACVVGVMLRYTTKPSINLDDYDYRHNIGRPYQGFEKLGDLKDLGYCEVIGIHLDGVHTATQDEKSNIELQLRNGVLL